METTQLYIDRWMDKPNVVYTYNRILFSLKKEENSDICYIMDEPWGHYAKSFSCARWKEVWGWLVVMVGQQYECA